MKRVLRLFLTIAFLLGFGAPVSAKSDPKVTLVAPTEAFWGDTVTVSVLVEAQNRGAQELNLLVPAGVAANVVASDGKVYQKEDGSWQIQWKNKFTKNAMTSSNEITMTLVDGEGEQDTRLLLVKSGRKQLTETWLKLKEAEPKPTDLVWSTSISATEVLAGEPFFWTFLINNPTDQVLPYNLDIESWYTCAQTNPISSSPSSAQLMRFSGDQFHTVWGWEGSVNPGEVVSWSLEMVTRPTALPDCGVIKLKNNLAATEEIFYMDVLANPLLPHGTMVMSNVVVGQPATLEVTVFSPNYTQFVISAVTSPDCQITDLPAGTVSGFPVTYKKFVYHPVVVVANNGQTGTVLCHLTAAFEVKYSGYPGLFSIESTIEVVFP